MAKKTKYPVTQGIRCLRAAKVNYTPHLYPFEEGGGTEKAAHELGLDEHATIKTLIMEDEDQNPLIVLMHGDLEVSTKELARVIGAKTIKPCAPAVAQKHSGYLVEVLRPLVPGGPCPSIWKQPSWNCPKSLLTGESGGSSWKSIHGTWSRYWRPN